MTPLNIVDNPSFVSLFEGMGVTVMHRTTAVKRINALVAEHITQVRNDLSLAAYVCTTADVWSTKQRSFFGVTAHWINDTYERCSVALACRRFNGSHTYDKVSEMLEDIHSQFNLDLDKLVATVSDNGSNFVKAFKEFGPTSSEEETVDGLVDEEFELLISNSNTLPKHVRCASHTLNLIATVDVKNAIQKNTSLRTRNTNALAKCNALWKMAGRPKTNEVIQRVLKHTLSYPSVTRWNSMYDSIVQIVNSRSQLNNLFEELGIQNQMFKESELDYLSDYCKVLEPLARAIDILQGDQNTFFGYLLPCLGSLHKKLTRIQIEIDHKNIIRPLLDACVSGLLKRFAVYFDFSSTEAKEAVIAAVTLPQFKLR